MSTATEHVTLRDLLVKIHLVSGLVGQDTLIQTLGVSRQALWSWLKGHYAPARTRWTAIAADLDAALDEHSNVIAAKVDRVLADREARAFDRIR